jgi:hypothetical protein
MIRGLRVAAGTVTTLAVLLVPTPKVWAQG